jgi:hypothetical protein
MQIVARFINNSGATVDEIRIRTIINELNLRVVSKDQMRQAETWILTGPPCQYGRLTLADFFPTRQQLESIGYVPETSAADAAQAARDAEQYRCGYEAGRAAEMEMFREWRRQEREKIAAEFRQLQHLLQLERRP